MSKARCRVPPSVRLCSLFPQPAGLHLSLPPQGFAASQVPAMRKILHVPPRWNGDGPSQENQYQPPDMKHLLSRSADLRPDCLSPAERHSVAPASLSAQGPVTQEHLDSWSINLGGGWQGKSLMMKRPAKWVNIPEQTGHRFHAKPDSDSISFRTPIPFESGQ